MSTVTTENEDFRGADEITHDPPTPNDPYCNLCGLDRKYWDRLPNCPAIREAQ